jgi:hypothetical protein
MHRVVRGDAKTESVLLLLASVAAVLIGAAQADASRTATPPSVDFGTVRNGPAGGRLETAVTYTISGDETLRYAFNMASGGAPNGSTQFSVGGGNCATAFPTVLGAPASCTILIQFDYARTASGLSTGSLVIDADGLYSTPADETTVPLRANLLAYKPKKKKRCTKKLRSAAPAKAKKCKRKKR